MFIGGKLLCFLLLQWLQCLVVGYTLACTCGQTHPQKEYCRSDFVLKGYIKDRLIRHDRSIFTFKVRKIFKGDMITRTGRVAVVKTDDCGKELLVRGSYIIFGHSEHRKLLVEGCSTIPFQYRVTQAVARYKYGCHCWRRSPHRRHNDCKRKHSHLNGRCRWVQTRGFRRCKRTRTKKYFPRPRPIPSTEGFNSHY